MRCCLDSLLVYLFMDVRIKSDVMINIYYEVRIGWKGEGGVGRVIVREVLCHRGHSNGEVSSKGIRKCT